MEGVGDTVSDVDTEAPVIARLGLSEGERTVVASRPDEQFAALADSVDGRLGGLAVVRGRAGGEGEESYEDEGEGENNKVSHNDENKVASANIGKKEEKGKEEDNIRRVRANTGLTQGNEELGMRN